jgi:hypothetical protein
MELIAPATFTLPAPDSVLEQKYLGLKSMEPFEVSEIKANLVVVEFMSAFCPHCHTNAPIVNSIFKRIQEDSSLADVKVIGVMVANKKVEVEAYKRMFYVPFPVMHDEYSVISKSMNIQGTPTTMIISTENGQVIFSQIGVIKDPDKFLKQLMALHKKR